MTLAGLQPVSFIPGTDLEAFRPGVAPSYEDVVAGREMVKYDRIPVKISEFHTEVFDMMSEADRKRYEERMLYLVKGIQSSECVIWKNDLQVMQCGGSQKWMRYLEWAKYEMNDPLLSRTRNAPKMDGSVSPKGVLSEVGGEDVAEEAR